MISAQQAGRTNQETNSSGPPSMVKAITRSVFKERWEAEVHLPTLQRVVCLQPLDNVHPVLDASWTQGAQCNSLNTPGQTPTWSNPIIESVTWRSRLSTWHRSTISTLSTKSNLQSKRDLMKISMKSARIWNCLQSALIIFINWTSKTSKSKGRRVSSHLIWAEPAEPVGSRVHWTAASRLAVAKPLLNRIRRELSTL